MAKARSTKSLVDEGLQLTEEIKSLQERLDEIKLEIKEILQWNAGSLDGKIGTVLASISKPAERLDAERIKKKFGTEYLNKHGLIKLGDPVVSLRFARKIVVSEIEVQEPPVFINRMKKA